MKKLIILAILILNFSSGFSQKIDANFGLGIGTNYGVVGVKSVIGKNNSGVLVGIGSAGSGILGFEVGYQQAYKSWFANVGYGNYGYEKQGEIASGLKAANLIAGYMIGIGKSGKNIPAHKKKLFIDLGIGWFLWKENPEGFEPITNINGTIGICYRISGR